MGSRPSLTKAGRTMPCSIFPSKNSRPGLESAIFLFRDSYGGTEGALKQRQSSAVWEQAREWRKSSRIERPRVGAARRADPRLRRESAESHKPNPPAEPPGRRSQRSSPPHPQTAHASSPRGRRAGARPKRDWASDWRAMEEQRSCRGVEGFLELAHGSHDFVEVRNIAEKHGAEHGLVVRAPIWQLLCGR